MELTFKSHGNEKQKEAYRLWANDYTTDIVYGGSKGSGKSYLGCSLIIGDALMYGGTHYFIARKKLNDLRKYTLPSIQEVFDNWGITEEYYRFNANDNFFEFYNKSRIYLLEAAHQPGDPLYERFGSMQMTRGWIEEAGEFEEAAKNNLFASCGRWKNDEYGITRKLLQTANPKKNYLYSEYYQKHKNNELEKHKAFIQALPEDNKKLQSGYLEHLEQTLSETEKQRLLRGNWEYDDNPYTLLPDYDSICNLFTNKFILGNGKRYMSCDIAYMGADVFVVTVWDGFRAEKVIALDKIDETAIGTKLIELAEEYRVPFSNIVYDADGLRKFTANSLKKLTASKPFVNNSQPIKDKQYGNLKTECAFKLKEMIEDNKIFIADQTYRKQIMSDLEAICREPMDDEMKIKLEKKSDHKKRTGRSPDFFDSLLMRMLFEVKNFGGWV
jgi:phage terminase large subunit